MPTTKTHVPSLWTLPPEVRKGIYEACDKEELRQLAQTCWQVNREIDPVVDELDKRNRSPWDGLRERHFPGLIVPKYANSWKASAVYGASEFVFPLHKVIEDLKIKAECKRNWARGIKEHVHFSLADRLARNWEKEAKKIEREAKSLSRELKHTWRDVQAERQLKG